MAVPAIDRQETRIYGTSLGSPAETTLTGTDSVILTSSITESYTSVNSNSSESTYSGSVNSGDLATMRIPFSSAQDLTTYEFVCFQVSHNSFNFPGPESTADTLANGGISMLFYDSASNYSEFHFFGNEYTTSEFDLTSGRWPPFKSPGASGCGLVYIDRTFTPDASNGTLDWSDISGFEVGLRSIVSGNFNLGFGSMSNMGATILYAGDVSSPAGFLDFNEEFSGVATEAFRQFDNFKGTSGDFQGAKADTFEPRTSFQIGNGTDSTYFRDTGSTIAMYPVRDSSITTYPFCNFDRAAREVTINTTVNSGNTFDLEMVGTVFACAADDNRDTNFTVTGTNSFMIQNAEWVRYNNITLGVGSYPGAIFNDYSQVEIDTTTILTGATSRFGRSFGLHVNTAPHDYSDITMLYESSNVGINLHIDPTSYGTFDFSGLTVESGSNINIWNASTTNSVGVTLAAGTDYKAIDLWFNYDNEASGPFTEGETLTFANSAQAELIYLVDSGANGTMYCNLTTGSAPPNNNGITGGTSSATADVNEAGGANKSSLVVDNSTVVSVVVTCKDVSDSSNVVGARVLLTPSSGGPANFEDSVSITRAGSTATVTHTAHGLSNSDKVLIEGADQSAYLGIKTISNVSANAYDFTVSGTPTTPATGTITSTTVILDGTTNSDGVISDSSYVYTSDQPVTGRARKGTTSPFYQTAAIAGTITTGGFASTTFMISDE